MGTFHSARPRTLHGYTLVELFTEGEQTTSIGENFFADEMDSSAARVQYIDHEAYVIWNESQSGSCG